MRRLAVLALLTAGLLMDLPAAAPEPLVLTGTWVGTWWMGKYEEPIEADLTQARQDLVGHVTLWGYPRAGASGVAAPVYAPLTGTVDGHRVQLIWTMPEQDQFSAELTLLSPDRLLGLGGRGSITTGFELHRSGRGLGGGPGLGLRGRSPRSNRAYPDAPVGAENAHPLKQ